MSSQLSVPGSLSSTAQAVQDQGGNKSQLFLTKGGNVGIGTNSPQQPLHVGQYQAGAAGSVGMIRIAHTSAGGSAFKSWDQGIANPNVHSSDPDAFSFYCVENQRVAIVMASNGFVGIQNPNPQQALDVAGTVKATGLQVTGLQSISNAPSSAVLGELFIDAKTGIVYVK